MSHLATIINRVEHRLKVYGGDIKECSKDSLWLQSICNLKEYQESWQDQTPEEINKANALFEQYKEYLVNTIYDYPRK